MSTSGRDESDRDAGRTREPIGNRVGSGSRQYPHDPTYLTADVYRDAGQHELERNEIFYKSWLAVGPASELERVGEYLVWRRLDQSVVIVRTDGGGLSAFHNVCQHRGMQIVEHGGLCTSGRFTCPWHGFSYDLEGRLVTAPLPETFHADELKGLRAPQVQVTEWNGMIWINLDDEAPELGMYLGVEFREDLEAYDIGGGWNFVREGRWSIGANWKTCVDAFNETWHVPFTHRDSVRGALLWKDAAFEVFDGHSMMVIPLRRKQQAGIYPTDDHRGHMLCHYLAFPNAIFNCFPTMLEVFVVWPQGLNESVLEAFFFVKQGSHADDDASIEASWQNFCEVVGEDVAVLNQAGRVAQSLGYARNMFNRAESRLTAFHERVAKLTGAAPPQQGPRIQ